MAKKKAEAEQADGLELLRKEIEAEYGKGVMVPASAILDREEDVIPVGPMLDGLLQGGIPEGSWVSIAGSPKLGKTTTALSFAANCQRPEHGSRVVHYFNVEKRLKRKNLNGIRGLDTRPGRFVIYESSDRCILTGKDHLDLAIKVLQSTERAVVILDSVSALVEAAVIDGGLGTATRGGGAKMLSQFVDIVTSVVPVKRSVVLGITHLINDTGGGKGLVEKAARRWLYQADVRLRIAYAESWVVGGKKSPEGQTDGGREIGKKVHWACQESAIGSPGGKCTSYLRYGVGVDRTYELLEMGRAARLFAVTGSWYEFSFLGGQPGVAELPKANGAEKAYALLNAHPEWAGVLQQKVNEFLGGTPAEGDGE